MAENNPEAVLSALWNDSTEQQAEESGEKPETTIKDRVPSLPACSDGCQARFDVLQTFLEQ